MHNNRAARQSLTRPVAADERSLASKKLVAASERKRIKMIVLEHPRERYISKEIKLEIKAHKSMRERRKPFREKKKEKKEELIVCRDDEFPLTVYR